VLFHFYTSIVSQSLLFIFSVILVILAMSKFLIFYVYIEINLWNFNLNLMQNSLVWCELKHQFCIPLSLFCWHIIYFPSYFGEVKSFLFLEVPAAEQGSSRDPISKIINTKWGWQSSSSDWVPVWLSRRPWVQTPVLPKRKEIGLSTHLPTLHHCDLIAAWDKDFVLFTL
jgi:hypothetical protein